MKLSHRIIWFFNLGLLIMVLGHSIYRDIKLDDQFPTDLRNRIVGARLQKDGKLPYHYHWSIQDGIRYYNSDESYWLTAEGRYTEKNPGAAPINRITGSPFFHDLLYFICDLPQREISRIWLFGEYVFLAFMIAMFVSLTPDRWKKWLLLNFGILFTTTDAWITLIASGQLYLFTSFLMSAIVYVTFKNKKNGMILGGLLAIVLVLCRPLTIFLFVPLLLKFKNYRVFLGTAGSGLLLYSLFVWVHPFEKALYRDYLDAMKSHIRLHQSSNPLYPPAHETQTAYFSNVEGFDLSAVAQQVRDYPVILHNENGNAFVLYFKIFHRKIPPALLQFAWIVVTVFLSALFYWRYRLVKLPVIQVLLLGFTLYMIAEIFSPIYRRQYNVVQWLPLLLSGILLVHHWRNPAFFLMMAGFLLNVGSLSWPPMCHTLGECCWLSGLLILIFSYPGKTKSDTGNIRGPLLRRGPSGV